MFQIYTLGDFDIKINNKSILKSIENQHRLMKLLKYFITFNNRKVLPYRIMDELWIGEEFKDPLSVLRTQISRLRNMIDFDLYEKEPFFTIDFIDGYYLFELKDNCEVDFIKLESCINRNNPITIDGETLDVCKKGVSLYKGEYLSELGYEDWLMPVRNRLDRLYITGLSRYLEILKEKSMDLNIISTCEEAINYKPDEEIIYLFLIESLVNIGQDKCALNHYQYYTKRIYTEYGESPSNSMKDLYEKIKKGEEEIPKTLNLATIDKEICKADNFEGAMLCNSSYFSFLYNFIMRMKYREENINIFIGIITIFNSGYIESPESNIKEGMCILLDTIYNNLRKGDVITQWNENQALLLLFRLDDVDIKPISERLECQFNQRIEKNNILLNIKFKKK